MQPWYNNMNHCMNLTVKSNALFFKALEKKDPESTSTSEDVDNSDTNGKIPIRESQRSR